MGSGLVAIGNNKAGREARWATLLGSREPVTQLLAIPDLQPHTLPMK